MRTYEPKHTPGPWKMEKLKSAGEWTYYIIGKHPDPSLPEKTVIIIEDPYSHDEEYANACLIAAAPELLAFCQQVLAQAKDENGRLLYELGQDELGTFLSRLIYKALGGRAFDRE